MDSSLSLVEPLIQPRADLADNPHATRRKPRQPYSDTLSLASTGLAAQGVKSGGKRKRGLPTISTNRIGDLTPGELSIQNRLSQRVENGQTHYVYSLKDHTELKVNGQSLISRF